ncbi:hypothetical protein JOB18_043853 [Solea senegalensis]|uniref:Family with sequence similarity 217, member B n=1 Tax=Solea senegalensis TaxID=28829 RepID=A0AAV6PPN9_SOLSE|nr:uncharacterized protein LOC122760543 [Solea senegalensis]KAG7473175.1 hypothetical protein JOB18_043853 [Solea senegalensis]
MGSVLQERGGGVIVTRGETERKKKKKKEATWSNNKPNELSNKMGRRQSQRKSVQPQCTFTSQENNNDKKLPQRRKHKPHTALSKCNNCQHSSQGTLETKSHLLSPAEDRTEPKVQLAARLCGHSEMKHTGSRRSRHTPAFPCHHLSDSSPDLVERPSPKPAVGQLSGHGDGDSDTDLSESERLPVSSSDRVPPQLELRPDTTEPEDWSARSPRPRHSRSSSDFPDFLPPPFNSWNLSQLALLYNMEKSIGASRPKPVGCLERYLEKLLQLEWCQLQTTQEESGSSSVSDVTSGCHRSPAAASSRLSTPKCILQCQRAFPLTLLSSLSCHSTMVSSCACTLNRIRHSVCNTPGCHSTHSPSCTSRPMLEQRRPVSLPKRSCSESRVHFSDRSTVSRAQRLSSPVRANSYLRRMQASGNIRNSTPGTNTKPHSTARDWSVGAQGHVMDYRTEEFRKRSSSEQRRYGGAERHQNGSDRRRSGSECRRGVTERMRLVDLKEPEIKPDAVTAIMDNLSASKFPPGHRPNRPKQVEFVT